MKLKSLIGHTAEIFLITSKSNLPVDLLISKFFRERKYLGSKDRKFISENLYDLIRNKLKIDYLSDNENTYLTKKEESKDLISKKIILLLITRNEKINENEILEIINIEDLNSLKLLANQEIKLNNFVEEISIKYSFPIWFVKKLQIQFSNNEITEILKFLNLQAPLTLRANTLKISLNDLNVKLNSIGIETVECKYSKMAIQVKKRLNVFEIEHFKNGYFEVQDEGSQIISFLVDPKPGKIVIDACAGSGGKSLAMASIMKNKGEIFALDVNTKRLNDIKKRIKRSGADTIRVFEINETELPKKFINFADYVLVDSPCSGTGTIRRNPGLKWQLNEADLNELNEKQQKIIQNYSQCVKIGGKLIYATCSILKCENEEIVEKFLSENNNFKLIDAKIILARYQLEDLIQNNFLKLFPHIHGTDGFFGAVFERIK